MTSNGVLDFIVQNPLIIPIIGISICGLIQGGYLGRRILDKLDKRRKISRWLALVFVIVIVGYAVSNIDRFSNQYEKTQLPYEIPTDLEGVYLLANDFVFGEDITKIISIFFRSLFLFLE